MHEEVYGNSSNDEQLVNVRLVVEAVMPASAVGELERLREQAAKLLGGQTVRTEVTVEALSDDQDIFSKLDEAARERQLDEPIESTLVTFLGDTPDIRAMIRVFEREGVYSLRDAVAIGKNEMNDMRGIADTRLGHLEGILHRINPTISWMERPTITDVARACPTLSMVPLRVLYDQYNVPKLSLQQALDMSPEELLVMVNATPGFDIDLQRVAKLKQDIEIYAEAFQAARSKLVQKE